MFLWLPLMLGGGVSDDSWVKKGCGGLWNGWCGSDVIGGK